MANAMVEELKKLSAGMSMTGASNTKAFLEQRIAKAREDLTQAEENLKRFQSKYKTLDAAQQATISASAVAQLTAQLTSQEIQLGVVRRSYADSSQTVKSLQQTISILREKITRLEGNGGSAVLPGFEQIPERGQEYLHLMRKFKTAEGVHEMLVRQYELAKLNAENDVSTIQVIQKALVPHKKSKPERSSIVALAAVTALCFSVVLAFTIEAFSRLPEHAWQRWVNLARPGGLRRRMQ
jgi:tyrosine-protein kinase Etk/Wzc